MTGEIGGEPRPGWQGEDGAGRLFAEVRAACAGCDGLPGRLEAALRVTLVKFEADPALARLLTVDPYLEGEDLALDGLRGWIERFGGLLHDAVADDPRTTTSAMPFLAGFVIGGVRFQIARRVLNHEASDLLRLLPSLLAGVLAYYFEPGEPIALAEGAIAAAGGA
jgi:hypothetical protein